MKKNKKANYRRCFLTFQILPKNDLIRVVLLKDKTVLVNSNLPGRGIYFSKNIVDFTTIRRKKLLHKGFKQNVSQTIYDELFQILEGGKNGTQER